jgi:hypothetical protein
MQVRFVARQPFATGWRSRHLAVTHCLDTDVTLLGALAWVATDGEEVSISGPYVGATCRAWVYDTAGRRTDPSKAVSNVVTFQG